MVRKHDCFGENFIKIRRIVSEIFNVFCFNGPLNSIFYLENTHYNKLCRQPPLTSHLLMEPKYSDLNLQTILKINRSVLEMICIFTKI